MSQTNKPARVAKLARRHAAQATDSARLHLIFQSAKAHSERKPVSLPRFSWDKEKAE